MANKFAGKLGAKASASNGFGSLIRGKKDVVEARWIDTDKIYSTAQVREDFDKSKLEGLASTLKGKKQHQPIIVYPADETGKHRIDMGERRWRAAQLNGEPVLAIVDETLDQTSLEPKSRIVRQLVENVAREDLNAFELGKALLELKEEGMSTNEIAAHLGKKAPWVSKHVKLAAMPPVIQRLFDEGIVTYVETLNILTEACSVDEAQTKVFINEMVDKEKGISRAQAQEFCDLLTGKRKDEPTPKLTDPSSDSESLLESNVLTEEGDEDKNSQQTAQESELTPDEGATPPLSKSQQKASGGDQEDSEPNQLNNAQDATDAQTKGTVQENRLHAEDDATSPAAKTTIPDSDFNVFTELEQSTGPKIIVTIDGEEWELLLQKSMVRNGEQFVECIREGMKIEVPAKDCIISSIS